MVDKTPTPHRPGIQEHILMRGETMVGREFIHPRPHVPEDVLMNLELWVALPKIDGTLKDVQFVILVVKLDILVVSAPPDPPTPPLRIFSIFGHRGSGVWTPCS